MARHGGRPGDVGLPRLAKRRECPVKFGGYDEAARAAIEAMREPTEEVIAAGCMALDMNREAMMAAELAGGNIAKARGKMLIRWNAMLDAALKAEG